MAAVSALLRLSWCGPPRLSRSYLVLRGLDVAIWPQLQLFGQLCAGPVNGIGLIEAVAFGSAAACATGTRPGDGWQK